MQLAHGAFAGRNALILTISRNWSSFDGYPMIGTQKFGEMPSLKNVAAEILRICEIDILLKANSIHHY